MFRAIEEAPRRNVTSGMFLHGTTTVFSQRIRGVNVEPTSGPGTCRTLWDTVAKKPADTDYVQLVAGCPKVCKNFSPEIFTKKIENLAYNRRIDALLDACGPKDHDPYFGGQYSFMRSSMDWVEYAAVRSALNELSDQLKNTNTAESRMALERIKTTIVPQLIKNLNHRIAPAFLQQPRIGGADVPSGLGVLDVSSSGISLNGESVLSFQDGSTVIAMPSEVLNQPLEAHYKKERAALSPEALQMEEESPELYDQTIPILLRISSDLDLKTLKPILYALAINRLNGYFGTQDPETGHQNIIYLSTPYIGPEDPITLVIIINDQTISYRVAGYSQPQKETVVDWDHMSVCNALSTKEDYEEIVYSGGSGSSYGNYITRVGLLQKCLPSSVTSFYSF